MSEAEVQVAQNALRESLASSKEATEQMLCQVGDASSRRLMELKAAFLERMVRLLPLELLGEEARKARVELLCKLQDYW